MEQASTFLKGKHNGTSADGRMKLAYKAPRLSDAGEEAYYYVFNVGNNGGFVIVSGDDRTEAILGYCDDGNYNADSIPDNMRWWLQQYAEQIKHLNDGSATTTTQQRIVRKTAIPTKTAILPLVTSKWNQDDPYWNLCPTYTSSGTTKNYYTGCVATAMAQIIYYHKWPQNATAVIPTYTTSTLKLSVPALPSVKLDWTNMLPIYTGSETTAQKTAVAQLMQYCGSSVNMDYNTGGSGAQSTAVPVALVNYFGYDKGVRYISRSDYSIADWDALIYTELKNKRPVYYSGASMSVGHAFVCDGYDTDNFYHINWGWGGMSDGYFRLSVLNSGSTGIGGGTSEDGFSMDQGAVIGIRPGDGTISALPARLTTSNVYLANGTDGTLTLTRTSTSNNFTTTIGYSVYNYLPQTYTFNYGVGLYKDGALVTTMSGGSESLQQYYGFNGAEQSVSFGANLANGTYQIKAISKESGKTDWQVDDNSENYYINAVVNDKQVTLTEVYPKAGTTNLTVNSLEFTGTKTAGDPQELKLTIANNGDEYNGEIYIVANKTTVAANGVALEAGKTSVVYFHYTPSTAGNYTIHVKLGSATATTDLYTTQVVIAKASTTAPSLAFSAKVQNLSGTKIWGNSYKFTLTVKNNGSAPYGSYIATAVFKSSSSGWTNSGQNYQIVNIPSGQSVDIPYEYDNLDYGSIYLMNAYYDNLGTDKGAGACGTSQYTMTRAIASYDASGNVTYTDASATSYTVPANAMVVDLQGTSVTKVNASTNPNCLYFFDAGATVPTTLSGKNVVKGGVADAITLTDGAAFYSPVAFTANNISYSRVFTKGADGTGKNWNTLILPFAATKVMNTTDNETLDWFHSNTETGKKLWIEEFSAEDNGTVYFSHAPAGDLKANCPYIISVAGNKWGEKWNLVGKTITFSATAAQVAATSNTLVEGTSYDFTASTLSKSASKIYYLNVDGDGNNFTYNETKTVEPFRAYFILRTSQYDFTPAVKSLSIGFWNGETTSINQPNIPADDKVDVYNINGMKVRSSASSSNPLSGLPKGIYIINGKKIVK
jgi:hypothetical protein